MELSNIKWACRMVVRLKSALRKILIKRIHNENLAGIDRAFYLWDCWECGCNEHEHDTPFQFSVGMWVIPSKDDTTGDGPVWIKAEVKKGDESKGGTVYIDGDNVECFDTVGKDEDQPCIRDMYKLIARSFVDKTKNQFVEELREMNERSSGQDDW